MKQQGRPTDGAEYAPTVRRRKLLTGMIVRAAEVSMGRRQSPGWAGSQRHTAAPIGARQSEFAAFVAWEEAWVNAIKEERDRLCKTQAKHRRKEPWMTRPKSFRAGSRQKRSLSGVTL